MRLTHTSFIVVLVGLILFLLFVLFAYVMTKRKHAKDAEDSIFITSKANVSFDRWYNLYTTFESIGITRHYLESLKVQFEILNPDNEKEVKERAIKTAMVIWTLSSVAILVMLATKPTLFTMMCVVWFIYFASTEVTRFIFQKTELALLNGFGKFVSEVRHNYFKHGMVDEAVNETFDKLDLVIKNHAQSIYNTITADDVEEAVFKYNRTAPNNFMKQFVSICTTTMKYGDRKVSGQSLFLMDIKDLKTSLDEYILRKARTKHKFMFLPVIASVPIFTADFMRQWGISTVPQLQKFYNGTNGNLLLIASFAVTFVSFWVIDRLKNSKKADRSEHPFLVTLSNWRPVKQFIFNFEEKNYTKTYKMQVLLKRTGSSFNTKTYLLYRIIYGICAVFLIFAMIVGLNMNQSHLALTAVSDVADSSTGSTEEISVAMVGLTKYYIDQYKDSGILNVYNQIYGTTETKITDEVKAGLITAWEKQFQETDLSLTDEQVVQYVQMYNETHSEESALYTVYYGYQGDELVMPDDLIAQASIKRDFTRVKSTMETAGALSVDYNYTLVATNVYEHLLDYEKAGMKWWYTILLFLAGVFGYNLPVIVLKINEMELQDFMEDEVVQFQSIIMILMYIDQMTVQTVLEEMSKYAFCFEESIQTCINNLSSGEEEALQALWDAEPFEPFRRLVENLMSVDRIGIKEAFNEIDIERKNYLEKRKQEGEIKLSDKVALSSMLAFVPFSFLVVVYMVYPFVTQSMTMMNENMARMGM